MVAEGRAFGEASRATGVLNVDRVVELLLALAIFKFGLAPDLSLIAINCRQLYIPGFSSSVIRMTVRSLAVFRNEAGRVGRCEVQDRCYTTFRCSWKS